MLLNQQYNSIQYNTIQYNINTIQINSTKKMNLFENRKSIIQNDLFKLLTTFSKIPTQPQQHELTASNIAQCLARELMTHSPQSKEHNEKLNQSTLYKTSLLEVGQLLIGIAYGHDYEKSNRFQNISHVVGYLSIVQHLVHQTSEQISPNIKNVLDLYVVHILMRQTFKSINQIYLQAEDSEILQNFVNTFQLIYQYRVEEICMFYGLSASIMMTNQSKDSQNIFMFLLKHFIKYCVENKDSMVDKLAMDDLILSIVYLLLLYRYQKQTHTSVIFVNVIAIYQEKIEEKYGIHVHYLPKQLIIHFYNEILIPEYFGLIAANRSCIQANMIECTYISDQCDFISQKILVKTIGDEGTVLDNINFSSSMEG